jgi:hypothetical protein
MAEFGQLCLACRGSFDEPHDITNSAARAIDHTKSTFLASVESGCRFCNLICRSMFGWIYTATSDGAIRDPSAIGIPDHLRLRYSFTAVPRDSEAAAAPQGRIGSLSDELRLEQARRIDQALREFSLGLRLNIWNEDGSDEKVSLVVSPMIRM